MALVTTKAGDGGTTGLFTGEREKKNHPVFDCLGTVDELVSNLGLVRAHAGAEPVEFLQLDLFKLNTVLASRPGTPAYPEAEIAGWDFTGRINALEARQKMLMDRTAIGPHFVVPGAAGSLAAAATDVARTVCRRAERRLVAYREESGRIDLDILVTYLNRASDYLFVLARDLERLAAGGK